MALADNRQCPSSWHTSWVSGWSALIVHSLNWLTELSNMPVTKDYLHQYISMQYKYTTDVSFHMLVIALSDQINSATSSFQLPITLEM